MEKKGLRVNEGKTKVMICGTSKKLTQKDCHEWKLTTVDPLERSTSRSGVRSAMHAASQIPGSGLPGRGPTDVDDALAPTC